MSEAPNETVAALMQQLGDAYRQMEDIGSKLHPHFVDDPEVEVLLIVLPSDVVEEALLILDRAVDLMAVNGWVGLAAEIADIRDLINVGIINKKLQDI